MCACCIFHITIPNGHVTKLSTEMSMCAESLILTTVQLRYYDSSYRQRRPPRHSIDRQSGIARGFAKVCFASESPDMSFCVQTYWCPDCYKLSTVLFGV
jgi:hypothetical protein